MAEVAKTLKIQEVQGNPIIPAPTAIETFRDSGYKSTAAALAELIDNSIEAEAKNIQVITFEEPVTLARRTVHQVKSIAVYDDGCGMPPEVLNLSLQFGMGTRINTRKGIGRFGIGLPNASVSQCRHVEVYSWQDGQCYKTHLDIDEIKATKQQNANPVIKCELPTHILSEIEGDVGDSGTLVVWNKCDRLDINKSGTLYRHMAKDLCRIYRHFLDNDNSYGNKVNVNLIVAGRDREVFQLKANDPLYLLTPNNVPEYENKATNLLHGSPVKIEVPYGENGKISVVEMRFSIALPEIQSLGGNSDIGQHYKNNTGISFVRACREIDFGDFGFFNPRDERQRWWGCEVRFDPVLDDLFGVTNNKQSLRGIRYIDTKEFEKEFGESWEDEIKDDPRLWLMYHLSKSFYGNHKKIMDTVLARGAGKRSEGGANLTEEKSTKIANDQLQNSTEKTRSTIESSSKTDEDKRNEWLASLEEKVPELSEEEKVDLVDKKSKLKIDFDFDVWPGEQFFTIETRGETLVVVLNKKHSFYTELYEPLCVDENDSRLSDALDLMMMAYARTEDELFSYEDELQEIRSRWGKYVQKFLKALKEEA
jgi:hypothetical protein